MRNVSYVILLCLLFALTIINFCTGNILSGLICFFCGFAIFTVSTWYIKNFKNKLQETTVTLFYLFYIFLLISDALKDIFLIDNIYTTITKWLSLGFLVSALITLICLYQKNKDKSST